MTKVPSLQYNKIINALQRLGFIDVRQKGSHIRLQKRLPNDKLIKITVPAHKPVLRSTLSQILKQTDINLDEFLKVL